MDPSISRNLDTQHRRLDELEDAVERLLAGDTAVDVPAAPGARSYAQLTAANDALRAERGWEVVDLDPALRADCARLPWALDDVAAVAVAGLIGVAATWFDSAIDSAVRDRLKRLKDTPLIRRWEREARGMPIDYTGPRFGGKAHRVRSAGHDIGRPFEALRQIRNGEFRGFYWEYGERREFTTGHYRPAASMGEALTLWGKHLVADVVTPMSLPLPGWTQLYELPSRQLRKFAHDAYQDGVNLRSATLSTLPVLSTEVVVRTHVHGRAMLARGTAVLEPPERMLRTELLLAGHSLVGAASLGRTLTAALTGPPVLAVKHLNWPVLVRAAMVALQVAADARTRQATVRSWEELLADVAAPWQLATAEEVDRAVAEALATPGDRAHTQAWPSSS